MLRRLLPCGLLALAALMTSGCGGDGGYRFTVYPASGKVTQKGKPVPKAIVRFHPKDPATTKVPDGQQGPPVSLTTETDEKGEFALSTYLADDGVPAGDYAVTVQIGLEDEEVENSDGKPSKRGPAIGKIYRNQATTTLKATVKPDGDNRFNFDLE